MAYSVFVVHLIFEVLALLVRMVLLRPLIGIRLLDYVKHIYIRLFCVVLSSLAIPLIIYNFMDDTTFRFFIICVVCFLSVGTSIYTIGLTQNEKSVIKLKVIKVYNKTICNKAD